MSGRSKPTRNGYVSHSMRKNATAVNICTSSCTPNMSTSRSFFVVLHSSLSYLSA